MGLVRAVVFFFLHRSNNTCSRLVCVRVYERIGAVVVLGPKQLRYQLSFMHLPISKLVYETKSANNNGDRKKNIPAIP